MTTRRNITSSWKWLLALFTIAGFVETMFFGQIVAFTPLYLPQLGIAPIDVAVWTGAIAAFANLIGIPFLPLWGALADRYARKPIIIRSFVVHLIAIILMLLSGSIWIFAVGRAVTSFALGNTGLMMTTLSERAPASRIGLAFSIVNSAPPVGAFVGPLLGGRIVDALGFQTMLLINGFLMLAVILSLAFGYRDDFHGTDRGPILHMAVDSVRIIGRSARLRVLFPALFLLFAGWMLAFTYAPLAIESLYQGSQPNTAIGLVLGAGGLATLVISPLVGALADRYGHWRVLMIGCVATVALWPLPAITSDLIGFGIAWAVLNGVTSGVFAISFTVLSSSAAGDVRGRVMSFAYLPINVGGFIGPAIGGLVTQSGVFTIFPVAAVVTLVGVGALVVAARQKVDSERIQAAA